MSTHAPIEPMEHDGSFRQSNPSSGSIPNSTGSAAAAPSPTARPPGPLSLHNQARTAAAGPSSAPQVPTTPRRIFCPVVGCAESSVQ